LSPLALAVLAPAADASSGHVVRVIDGDTVQVRVAGRVRAVDLAGVDAPEPGGCHAGEARQALRRLLPRGARVRLVRDPAARASARYVYRGGTLLNARLLDGGHARAVGADQLRLKDTLVAGELAARTKRRGLWAECGYSPSPSPAPGRPTPASPPAAPPSPAGGEDPRERARRDLAGRLFKNFSSTVYTSTDSYLNLCPDGTYIEEISFYSSLGAQSVERFTGTWQVLAAEYGAQGAAARVQFNNSNGTVGYSDFVAANNAVYINGKVNEVQPSQACG
jgi:micrococcal nuclease